MRLLLYVSEIHPALTLSTNGGINFCGYYMQLYVTLFLEQLYVTLFLEQLYVTLFLEQLYITLLLEQLHAIVHNVTRRFYDCPKLHITRVDRRYYDSQYYVAISRIGFQEVIKILTDKKVKVRSYTYMFFLYSAVTSPLDGSKRLHLATWQTCSFQRHFDFSGKHSAAL